MSNPTSVLGKTVNVVRRCVCVLALTLVFLAAGVDSKPSREVRGQESTPAGATDTTTVGVEVTPTEIIPPATATLSPKPNADGRNEERVPVTLVARMKAHRIERAS
jgi:hypothetical protein